MWWISTVLIQQKRSFGAKAAITEKERCSESDGCFCQSVDKPTFIRWSGKSRLFITWQQTLTYTKGNGHKVWPAKALLWIFGSMARDEGSKWSLLYNSGTWRHLLHSFLNRGGHCGDSKKTGSEAQFPGEVTLSLCRTLGQHFTVRWSDVHNLSFKQWHKW